VNLKALHISRFILALAMLVMVVAGCSRKKSGFTHRLYHNTTSQYNWYFNSNEILKETDAQLWASKQDDYLELIPVFVTPNEEQQKALYPEMDKIIDKCSTLIDRHSMEIEKKEHNKWIDDAYMLIGVANFYKGNYSRAQEMFSYVAKKYKGQSSRFEAALWLARTYTEQKNYNKASTVLSVIEKDNGKDRPKDFEAKFNAIQADKLIRQQRYKEAIPFLEDAALHTRDRQMKARLTFIKAQCHKVEGRNQAAIKAFEEVVALKPDYEMEFYAKIGQALAFDRKMDSGKIKNMLLNMAKDERYREYQDQVYYALAEIEYEEQNVDKAKEYLKTSARRSVSNPKQKGKSYLKLADIYFDDKEYVQAKNYYDSTATFLPEDFPNYKAIVAKGLSLHDLVQNLEIIELNDSLLALAAMNERDLEKKLLKMIAKLESELEEKKKAEREALERLQYSPGSAGAKSSGSAGSKNWYFYNPGTLGAGFQEFQRRWGSRRNEDNWRRSRKTDLSSAIREPNAADTTQSALGRTVDEKVKSLEEFLAEVPLSPEAQAKLHNEIIAALYDIGTIYKEKLKDDNNSIESFLRITVQYDTSATAPAAYYQLYRIYLEKEQSGAFVGTGFKDNSEYYKNVILMDYPDTEYARLILDPNFKSRREEMYQAEKAAYEEIYKKYNRRQYLEVLTACNNVINTQPDNNFLAKYYLVKAFAAGARQDADLYEETLRAVIAKFPNTEEQAKASELLGLLNEAKVKLNRQAKADQTETTPPADTGMTDTGMEADISMFNVDETSEHFFALVFPKEQDDANKIKEVIADFNTNFFKGSNLRITNSFIDKEHQIIIVRSFADKAAAMDYYTSFVINKTLLKELNEKNYTRFAITTKNFTVLFRNKNTDAYAVFFDNNYLK
jgi:tetratricopeptide (TPR) repeat protein